MPRKHGDEVVAQLRVLGYDGVVIAATGTSEPGVCERLLHCGFDGVLTKPFASKEISAMLHRMLVRPGERRSARAQQLLTSIAVSVGVEPPKVS